MTTSLNGLTTEKNSLQDNQFSTLYMALHKGTVRLSFKKKDGETREMLCTLKSELLPAKEDESKEKKKNSDVLAVWDLEKEGWRSFRYDSLIAWDIA